MLHLITMPSIGLFKIVGIVNGTINFLLSRVAEGVPWEQALEEAVKKQLTEGGSGLEEVFRREIRDTVLKAACIVNLARLFPESMVTPDEFTCQKLGKKEILRLFEARQYRLVVRIVRQTRAQTPFIPHLFHLWREGWSIIGEFEKPNPEEFPHGVPKDEQNMLAVWNHAGRSEFCGIGAGARPTAAMMLREAEQQFFARQMY